MVNSEPEGALHLNERYDLPLGIFRVVTSLKGTSTSTAAKATAQRTATKKKLFIKEKKRGGKKK